jgi:hypothetical protein
MDLLRNLFGNVTARIVRLGVAAGVLFLCYLFKPVLKTTTDAIHSTGLDRIGKSLEDVGPQIQREVRRTFHVVKARGGDPQRLVRCVKRAHQDVKKLERCTRRF